MKMKMKISVFATWCAFFAAGLILLHNVPDAAGQGKRQPLPKQPIQITSDRLEAFNDRRLVVFDGHAVAVQGPKVIRAEKLLVYYKQATEEAKPENGVAIARGGDLERIEARGKVRITEFNRVVSGEDAVYYQDEQKIVVTGNAVMREGENVVRGERITVLLNENRGFVEGTTDKRVSATIYPGADDGKKR